jgi:6-phospho-beta-glucosidase
VRLVILGGGGFRVPLVYQALLDQSLVDELVLYDTDPDRLAAITAVLAQLGHPDGQILPVRASTELDEALAGADFVFSAVRVGGLAGRISDERVALDLGVLGQETTGPGGIAYGLRTIPVALHIARRVQAVAPGAFVINFTNPAGMITEAMRSVLGDRVAGICDTPSGLVSRVIELATGGTAARLDSFDIDYVGLNHLGWLRGVKVSDAAGGSGRNLLAEVLGDDSALARLDETRAFGADWLRMLGAIPNEYLVYYYCARESLAGIQAAGRTRGEFLRDQQRRFYAEVQADPHRAARLWRQAHAEREATYLAETRAADEQRLHAGGGYERVALALMSAIARDERATMILNVAAGSAVPGLPSDAVVEIACTVGADGIRALPVPAARGDQLGLMQQLKQVERLTIEAAVLGRPESALQAFALHPLVDSIAVARSLLAGYRAATPTLFTAAAR